MRKFLSLLVALATVTMAWAAQGGTLTSSKTPIDPTQTVTLTYDGTGTNFANWEPSCFIHAWLVAADGQTLSKSYSTDWASCNGDGDYASLASKLKMTYSGTKGKYTISMNIKEFFNVADADLPKIGKLGVIVRAQYEGDNNKTNDMFVNVAYTTPAAGTSVTYTVESTSKVNVTGTAPEGSSATYASTYNTKCQLTSGKSMTLTLSGFEGNKITGITLSMKSNKSGGKGSFTAVAGTTTIASIADAAFNTASWNGAWSQEYVDVIPTMTKSDYTVQKDENVVITIAASANSLYCQSFTVYYDKGATPPTPVDSTTLYFVNALDWTAVNGFVWPAEGDAYKTWPGEAAKKTADKVNEKDIYSYTFPSSFVNVIFNNGTDQTADLAWAAAKPYFVPGAKNAAGKYEGTWYASKDDIPAPELPAKYYITGDSALVVDAGLTADKAWAPAAIKADADTTVLNLKTGVEYKLKVTVDGTWATALGYDALSEKAEGLIADADGNICFKLAEAGAVQVVYFKKGDVVTFKVLGKFYIKPVIVETLNLVPNMWSEAGAKMAAWVWGEGLAGAWTPFFAGEGDTLSVKINAEADSIIFVRMNSDATEPDWSKEWNRVKDEEIDHVGLTYTITAWGDEGVSVGQWTPYEPVVPGKYYITGDSALVVDAGLAADKAWTPAAIKADADTTVLNLKAGVEYKLKVTVDGTWATALGYDALSEKAEGLIADADGNICFKLAEAGAVQVIYFKEGDVVTFKVLGKFYIKPVIVETLNLVPNMWSEAGAKMAAWVWGEGLAGAWTPFFAGEGDTLSVKINAEADSIIFVRFASDVTAPAWDATLWNRVKDEEIDHVGLTYTITAWGDEGVSVGQWTPYEPAGGCDWDNLPWLGSALPAYAEQFKICLGDPKPGVVNIQESFGTEAGIYVTFPSAAFGQISLSEGQYAIQGAGMLLYVSAFTAKETEVSVVCENVEYVFTVYNDKGGDPVCKDKYGLKVGETVVEFAKNEAQTEWVEYYKQGVELTAGDVIVLYNICEDQTFAAKVAGYEGLTPLVGGDGWTVTETAKYDFYLKLIYGADELYVAKQGDTPVEGKYFITGDSALVVDAGLTADKAWTPAAIKADADTTILNLKANVDYKLKITLDGTWNTALGYDALSEKAEGLIADADGNICFKLAEAGAVQVIYFKAGDVVTFKVLGKFYIKPVIVETLKLVPNMWSEAGAKMAAWVWGEGLAGAWTPFFAGEGDTLSVKINAEADSVVFVRFASDVTAPAWDATLWNRVKDEEIDHVGLTYTITAWGAEGVSVGQWTPYEPAGGCDWDNLPWLGSALPAYAEQFKICLGDPKPGVVNIQESFGTEAGIYVTFPSAAFGQISMSEGQYAIQGAGMLLYVSAFTAKETEVSVVCENVEYVFTVYNDKGGEPVCEGKYGLKVGDNVVEFTKNEAQTEWTEYYKQGVELTQGQFIALYNICEETAFTATIAGYEGFTPATGGWTVTETAKYDFYLKLIYGADELYVVKQGSGDTKFYMKNNWDAGVDWTWKEMTKDGDNYKLENVVFGGSGVNYNTSETDEGAAWVEVADILGDKIAAKDTVTFVLNPTAKTVTATIVGKYIPTGDVQYFMKNNWNAGADWTWKEMTKDGDNYKLENVVYGGTGVNYNTEATDANATWVAEADIKGDKLGAKDTVNLVLNPVAGTVTATIVGKYVDPTPGEKVYTIVGVAALVGVEWNPEATDNDMAKQADGSYKLVKENVALASGTYDYKVVEGHSWDGWQIPAQGNQTLNIEAAGVYNVTFTLDAALTTLTANAVSVGPMPEQEYGLMIDGTTFIKAQPNPATANEYMVLDVDLTAGQTLQIYDKTNEVGWAIDKWNEGSYQFEIKDNKYIVTETAKYDFYVNLEYGNDYIYVAKKETPSAIENLVAPANELRKVMIDGKLYIMRDGKVYSVQGQLIR